jgi:hypothetical protein
MFGEIDLLGAFVPRTVTWLVTALLIFATADWFAAFPNKDDRKHIFEKLEVEKRTQAVARAQSLGLTTA